MRGKFRGIVYKGVYHKEGERLVGLHHRAAIANRQSNSTRLEEGTALFNDCKQPGERETLHLQVHIAAAHLYPTLKDYVKVVEFFGKFGNILKFTLCIGRWCSLQGAQFVYEPVDVWTHGHNSGDRDTLQQILAFMFGQIDGTGMAHLVEPLLLVDNVGKTHSLTNGNRHIWHKHLKQRTLLARQCLGGSHIEAVAFTTHVSHFKGTGACTLLQRSKREMYIARKAFETIVEQRDDMLMQLFLAADILRQ